MKIVLFVLAVTWLPQPSSGLVQGHGPVYGLSTPTLGRGAWSLDVSMMGRSNTRGNMAMIRPMVSYGITEDIQVSASAPIRLASVEGLRPLRSMTRMPATQDAEVTLGWRFQRLGTGVGSRFESTAFVSASYPIDDQRAGLNTAPRVTGALVTGYASRTVYIWVGGLYGRTTTSGDGPEGRTGDTAMYSVVLGYRPPFFKHDYPAPDWRIFVETVGEWTGSDRVLDMSLVGTGSQRVLLAPTLLGLYGSWGVAGGPALPVYQRLNSMEGRERVRWVVNIIFWF